MEYEVLRMENGVLNGVGVWRIRNGAWSMNNGVWSMEYGVLILYLELQLLQIKPKNNLCCGFHT